MARRYQLAVLLSSGLLLIAFGLRQAGAVPFARSRLRPVAVSTEVRSSFAKAMWKANLDQPLSLASDDFNNDGLPDLIAGYREPFGGGVIRISYGNAAAFYVNTAALSTNSEGSFAAMPFFVSPQLFSVPEPPDYLGVGDFDRDGHCDGLVAARGGGVLYLLKGDGHGGLGLAQRIELTGRLTALAIGEINRADGLPDVIAGVVGKDGPRLLVFQSSEGAMKTA